MFALSSVRSLIDSSWLFSYIDKGFIKELAKHLPEIVYQTQSDLGSYWKAL